MPRLIEANIFAKLLSVFFDKRAKGKEDELEKKIAASGNKDAVDAYRVWKSDSEKLLLTTRKMLASAGLDTTNTDRLLKKYHNY